MILGQFVLDVLEANAFILGCRESKEALLVDAGMADARFKVFLQVHGLRLTKVFVTHHHYDHTDGLAEILRDHGADAYSYLGEAGGVPTQKIGPGELLRIGRHEGRVVHTPGHTEDGLSLIFPGIAFTGDALFAGSVGGTSSEEDAQRQLQAIREHLFTLPDDTELHVGHGPSSTVGIERRANPFFT